MSASGYKRTSGGNAWNVRFTPESGHSDTQERVGLKKQTLDVRFAPNSGHKWLWCRMSAFDPKRTLMIQRRERTEAESTQQEHSIGKWKPYEEEPVQKAPEKPHSTNRT